MSYLRQILAAWLCLAAVVVICPALLPAQQTSASLSDGAARVLQLSGQVSVLRDSGPWALSAGAIINPRQIILTGPDGFAIFQVSDGSTFEVYPNSRVTFRANAGSWK